MLGSFRSQRLSYYHSLVARGGMDGVFLILPSYDIDGGPLWCIRA